MKILMATMGLDIGGAETHIVELSKELKNRGHDIVIVSNGGVYVPEILAAGIRHYDAPMHRRSLGEMRRSMAILRDVIRREAPDGSACVMSKKGAAYVFQEKERRSVGYRPR